MTPEQEKLYKEIDEILWNDWDPIGVNDSAPRNEYEAYTPAIFSLKIKGANSETIAEKLYEFESVNMGSPGDMNYCLQIAEKIIALR